MPQASDCATYPQRGLFPAFEKKYVDGDVPWRESFDGLCSETGGICSGSDCRNQSLSIMVLTLPRSIGFPQVETPLNLGGIIEAS